jgi:DtxR family Mn-dependent transcriptional regulator
MSYSLSEEDYLKAIFSLYNEFQQAISTSKLADSLSTKASSVTEMIQKLADKNLVTYQKYYGVHLTDLGKKQALKIIRKHRLWEYFLVESLDFKWDQVHDIAEQLEHIDSDELVDKLDLYLGYPKFDPHGDPIPDKEGNLEDQDKFLLVEADMDKQLTIVGVKDSSSTFLKYMEKKELSLGTVIRVMEREEFDHSHIVKVDGKAIQLSMAAARNIYVQTKNNIR